MTLLSLMDMPEKYAADPAPAYWNFKYIKKYEMKKNRKSTNSVIQRGTACRVHKMQGDALLLYTTLDYVTVNTLKNMLFTETMYTTPSLKYV